MSEITADRWNEFLQKNPQAHILQTEPWGRVKSAFGWKAVYFQVGLAGTQMLLRALPGGFQIAYIPRGPVGKDWSILWPALDRYCKDHRVIFLKVEPDAWEDDDSLLERKLSGFVRGDPVQPRRTLVVDLQGDEDQILAAMKQKTRYNIRLAEKKGIVVRESEDVAAFYRLMLQTGKRDGFGVHSLDYYQAAYQAFLPGNQVALLIADYANTPLAGLMVFRSGQRSWYFYGASNDQERHRMPTYLLQWRAMQWAKTHGCVSYDLWGVPDYDEETLESQFEHRSDGLWGVYRFKRGFGGQLKRSAGAWDRIYSPALYRFYRVYRRFRGGINA